MTRAGAMVAALLLPMPAFLSHAHSQAQAQAQVQAPPDQDRVALIARAKPSLVHVKALPKPPPGDGKAARNDTFEQLMAQLERSGGGSRPQEGSGFVVDSARGLILTAAHIVADSPGATVVLADGRERAAAVVAAEKETGIALLRVGDAAALPELALSTREAVAGETVVALGWVLPLTSVLALDGMVAGPAPGAGTKDGVAPALVEYVALDLQLPNGGFGGGPVLDREGKVVGMVSAIFGRDYGSGSLTLMIPAAQIAPRLEALRTAP